MSSNISPFIWASFCCLAIDMFWGVIAARRVSTLSGLRIASRIFDALLIIASVLAMIGFIQEHDWFGLIGTFLILFLIFRRKRKGRKRIRKLVGEKAKAALRKLVKTLRQLKPRSIRIPMPVPN